MISGKSTHGPEANTAAACHVAEVLWTAEVGGFYVFEFAASGRGEEVVEISACETEG